MQKPQLKRSQQSPYWDDREPQRGGGPPAGVKVMKRLGDAAGIWMVKDKSNGSGHGHKMVQEYYKILQRQHQPLWDG